MLRNIPSLLLFLIFLLPSSAIPQVMCALGSAATSYDAYADQRPTSDAMQLASRVSAALVSVCSPNCPTLVLFRNTTAPNAILLADSGRAKMVYSPEFFTTVYEKYGDGAIIAFIAHMLGHAIEATAPAGWMKRNWTPELRADAWTGCALANADLSSTALREALTAVSAYPSPSHPDWPLRVPALRLGYTQCGGDGEKFDARISAVKRK